MKPAHLTLQMEETILVKDKTPSQRGVFNISPKDFDPNLHVKVVETPSQTARRQRLEATPPATPEAQVELAKMSVTELRKLPEYAKLTDVDTQNKQTIVEGILRIRAEASEDEALTEV